MNNLKEWIKKPLLVLLFVVIIGVFLGKISIIFLTKDKTPVFTVIPTGQAMIVNATTTTIFDSDCKSKDYEEGQTIGYSLGYDFGKYINKTVD